MDYLEHVDSPLGGITLASDGEALVGLWFDGQKHFAWKLDSACVQQTLPVLEEARRWLKAYWDGLQPRWTLPLRLRGTDYQRAVWRQLQSIPYGRTVTYGAIAAALHSSPRAVGTAVGCNPISLIIPCHRVVGADGSLTGYAGGLDKKEWLLNMEKLHTVSK